LRCQAEEDAAIVMIQATCNMIEIDDNKWLWEKLIRRVMNHHKLCIIR
jgi:hypothetical protein